MCHEQYNNYLCSSMYDICDSIFYFFVTALTMRNIVLFFALIAIALAADRCAVTNPIDCGFPGML